MKIIVYFKDDSVSKTYAVSGYDIRDNCLMLALNSNLEKIALRLIPLTELRWIDIYEEN